VQNTGFSTNKTLNINGRLINLETPGIMGIINVTPDSFYSGSRMNTESQVLHRAEKMLAEGADIIDVGGYSTRPGAATIDAAEETDRVLYAIRTIVKHFPGAAISVDSFRSGVVRAAVSEGAGMINDVSGGTLDTEMFKTVADLKVPYVLMHMRGDPQTMAGLTRYDNLLPEMIRYFHEKIFVLTALGVKDILIDPGFGFAKTREQNFQLLNHLADLQIAGRPIMAGLSRKSMVWKTLDIKPEEALNGTSALHAVALLNGASMLRVHDVKECAEVIRLMGALKSSGSDDRSPGI
jgi:dihydropteroate synthase